MSVAARHKLASHVRTSMNGCPDAVLYGSFVNGTFHYDERAARSLSDVDVIIPLATPVRRRHAALEIGHRLRRETGLCLRVSVRSTRIHDNSIPNRVAPVVGFFEMLSKVKEIPSSDCLEYLTAKFLLRALAPGRYFRAPGTGDEDVETLVDHWEYARLMRIKRGFIAGSIAWGDLIERIADPQLRQATFNLWTQSNGTADLGNLLPEYRGWFTGIEAVYFDLHRKVFSEGREVS